MGDLGSQIERGAGVFGDFGEDLVDRIRFGFGQRIRFPRRWEDSVRRGRPFPLAQI